MLTVKVMIELTRNCGTLRIHVPPGGLTMSSGRVSQFPSSITQSSKAGSFRLFQRVFKAYLSIRSEASVEVTRKPSSSSIMESILKYGVHVHTSQEKRC